MERIFVSGKSTMLLSLYRDHWVIADIVKRDDGWAKVIAVEYKNASSTYYCHDGLQSDNVIAAITSILTEHLDGEDSVTRVQAWFAKHIVGIKTDGVDGIRTTLSLSSVDNRRSMFQFNMFLRESRYVVELLYFDGQEAIDEAIELRYVGEPIKVH